jgi:hypothetical protein
MDLHDGSMSQSGATLYLYGTKYGCGFNWGTGGTPWCGFGVANSGNVTGPWSSQKLLFNPNTKIEATGWSGDSGMTWDHMCGLSGAGCFNPRMVKTPSGQWLLWFNAPGDRSRHANPYWVLSCNGPDGPCSNPHKPAIYGCNNGGDFSIAIQDTTGYLVCSGDNRIIGIEKLASGDLDGLESFTNNLSPGVAEGVGIYHDASGYVATFSTPNCGYCSGIKAASPGAVRVQTGYSIATNLSGPWTYQGILPGGYCTGQPRTVFKVDGIAYEWVDELTGKDNETSASILLVPMAMRPWSCNKR